MPTLFISGSRGSAPKKVIIFTDLDGSLLNHDDYSFDGAVPSLERISDPKVPLIIATSKTRREVELLQGVMGIREPFIIENGGGIFFTAGYRGFTIPKGQPKSVYTLVRLGMPYSRIRSFFVTIRAQFGARGFGDLSVEEVSELTGLSLKQAELAKAREFTEPFLLERDEDLPFWHVLAHLIV
ncbi:MAG: HAD hydrolase family protein, partial [Syntrophales bacterium]|nr:HAD hydrolase family protein [Syntrophales bacterium]